MTTETPGRWEGIDRRTHAALGDSTLRSTYLSGVATGHEEGRREALEEAAARIERTPVPREVDGPKAMAAVVAHLRRMAEEARE